MKVYRGPSSKDFSDDTHQLVSSKDLSKEVKPWSIQYTTTANLTKETLPERQAVAHIGLSEADVLSLYRALIDEKLRMFDELQGRVKQLETKIEQYASKLRGIKVAVGFPAYSNEEKVSKIKDIVDK